MPHDGDFSSRIVVANGGAVAAGAGAAFAMSQAEMDDLAREEYERVLEDLKHQDGVTG